MCKAKVFVFSSTPANLSDMESIEKQLMESVETLKKKFAGNEQVKAFEKTNDQFQELVEKGIVKKRGHNLLSPADAHVKNKVWFNA